MIISILTFIHRDIYIFDHVTCLEYFKCVYYYFYLQTTVKKCCIFNYYCNIIPCYERQVVTCDRHTLAMGPYLAHKQWTDSDQVIIPYMVMNRIFTTFMV